MDKANNKFLQVKEEGFVVDPHFHPQSLKEWTDPDCGLEAISIVPTKQGGQMNKDWVDRFDRHDIHTKIMCPNCMHTPNCYVMVMC